MAFFQRRIKPSSPPVDLAAISADNPHLQQPQGDGTEHYVTLFDANFLPQGLCLYYSLVRHGGDFVLWVLCIDRECLDILQRINLPRLRLLDLEQLESPELLAVKSYRSRGEYCWTLTPFSIRYVFEADNTAQRVTYVDSDIFFLRSPQDVIAKFIYSQKAVLLTPADFAPHYDQSESSGYYCVQFMIFSRGRSEIVRKWWEDRCLEWCFARAEAGKMGDQKYLDFFPILFSQLVYSLDQTGCFLAPWNAISYPFSSAVAFHFHGLRIYGPSRMVLLFTHYDIPLPTIDYVYRRYLSMLAAIELEYLINLPTQGRHPVGFANFLAHGISRILHFRAYPGHLNRLFGRL